MSLSLPISARARVAIVLDNPRRDFNGVALMAHALLKRGADVFVVPMYEQGYDLPLLAPDVVIVNYARLNNQALLETYKSLGIAVCVMDTEGGVLSESGSDSPANWARLFNESGLAKSVDDYCFWGSRLHAAFAQASGLATERLHVTGCPRYDLVSPRWRDLLDYPRSGFVLVNSNFSAVNPKFTRSAQSEAKIFEIVGFDSAYTRTLFAEWERVFPQYVETIAQLARACPSEQILVRPHPFENEDFYRRRFADHANVVVDGNGDVLNVIRHAKCIVHLNCGTAVETALLGKPAISLEFLNSPTMLSHTPLPSRLSIATRSLEDLVSTVRALDSTRPSADAGNMSREIEPWFHVADGAAADRVADVALAAVKRAVRPARRSIGASIRGGRQRPRSGQLLQGLLGNLIGSRAVAAIRAMMTVARRAKRITPETAAQTLHRFAAHERLQLPLRVAYARHPFSGLPLNSIKLEPVQHV